MQLGGVEIAFMSAEFFGAIMLFLGFTGIIWLPITWITLSLLTPKILIETYFKEPHFSKAELALFSVFPGTLGRTGIFMGSCFQERYRRNRQLEDFLDLVPTWYVRASKIFAFFTMVYLVPLILLGIGAFIYL